MDKRSGRLSTQTARPVAIKADIKQTIHRFEVPVAAPSHWWQDDLDLVKGIRARMIIDPADGKIPPLTPQAQRRAATGSKRKRTAAADRPTPGSTAACTIDASRAVCRVR